MAVGLGEDTDAHIVSRLQPREELRGALSQRLRDAGVDAHLHGTRLRSDVPLTELGDGPLHGDVHGGQASSPDAVEAWLREPLDDAEPGPTEDSLDARFFTLDELDALPGRGNAWRGYIHYVAAGGVVMPLSALSAEGAPLKAGHA